MKSLFKQLFKSEAFRVAICRLLAGYIRFVYYTSRRRIDIHPDATAYMLGTKPAVFAFWHARMLMIPMIHPKGRKMHVLISSHRDGELIARTMHLFGFGTVRGSTTRGGATGAMNAVRMLKQGDDVAVTPDGPRGPAERVQPGVLAIARLADMPVIPVAYASTRQKRARSWDKFIVALPFGSLYYKTGAPVMHYSQEALETEMMRITCEVDALAGA
jgi:lysophospholipid acyltransferase (LPLAT)-like uncharacterized protein